MKSDTECKKAARILQSLFKHSIKPIVVTKRCVAPSTQSQIVKQFNAQVRKRPKDIGCVVRYGRLPLNGSKL